MRGLFAAALVLSSPLWGQDTVHYTDIPTARANARTLLTTYILRNGTDGALLVKTKRKTLRLNLKKVESDTVHRLGLGVFACLADFTVEQTGGPGFAEVVVDFREATWRVDRVEWLSAGRARQLRKDFRAASIRHIREDQGRSAARAKKQVEAKGSPLDVTLRSRDGSREVWLANCPTEKCLTIFVTPWCDYCRKITPYFAGLESYLTENKVTTRVIVGKDRHAAVVSYADEIGPQTLLDLDDAIGSGPVPRFYVSKDGGKIIRQQSGMSKANAAVPERFAQTLGLP